MNNFFCQNPLEKIQPELLKLEKAIGEVAKKQNKVEAIVLLFQVISPLHDNNPFAAAEAKLRKKSKNKKQLEALQTIQQHFVNAGRSEYGLNRTKKGEEVTADKVYLGNIFGLFTKPASYWLTNQEKLKQEFGPGASIGSENPSSSWYLINDYQAGKFVRSHIDGILKQIAILKA